MTHDADKTVPSYDHASHGAHSRTASLPRARLIAAMKLKYDPFSSGVSERELAPDFGSIYVDVQPGLLDALRRPQVSCVFAAYGMGKTATRIALEYGLRLADAPVALSVSYNPTVAPVGVAAESSLESHLAAILRELRVDLLVQYIERLAERVARGEAELTSEQRRALQRQARALPRWMVNSMRVALADAGPDGAFWRRFRPAVRYVSATPAWRALVSEVVQAAHPGAGPAPGWQATLADVRALGFEQVYLLIDAVDEGRFAAVDYYQTIAPLLGAAADLAAAQIYLKLFLPLELRAFLRAKNEAALTSPLAVATIGSLSSSDLDKLITDRFEAARSSAASFSSLDWLGQELDESVQGRLIEAAQGSPRRLIELASALLDFHSLNGFRTQERLWLTRDEWQRFLDAYVERSLPAPT